MGIFGKGSSSSNTSSTYMMDQNESNINSSASRSRRSSASASSSSSQPISIVPAPSRDDYSMKSGGSSGASNVFGRQQSWSDQLADAALLQGATTKLSYQPMISASHNMYSSSSSNQDVKFVHSTMEILENQIKREEAPKKKRTRTSTEQLRILQKAFQTDPMPNSGARMVLSKRLGMSSRAVQVWFQNRRAKEKLDAKRNVLGHSSSSGFSYINGNANSEDEDEDDLDCEDGYEEEDINESVSGSNSSEKSSSSAHHSTAESHSMKGNKMMGRLAFNNNNNNNNTNNNSSSVNLKAHRSLSTPDGYFQGNNYLNNNSSYLSTSSTHHHQNHNNHSHLKPGNSVSSYNPLCNLFPGETTFISDVNEAASVDQLYQDLSGVHGGVLSPIENASCSLLNTGNNGILQMSQGSHNGPPTSGIPSSTSASHNNYGPAHQNNLGNNGNFYTFGDPFYGGGIIDRTPSVSPVGFGPRSSFYPIGGGFEFLNFPTSISPINNINNSSSFASSTEAPQYSNAAYCKGPSGGNVYLTSSVIPGSFYNTNSTNNRRSFSLPEAHGNLSSQQMQQLESNFGLQAFPSPLLSSINEEDHHSLNLVLQSAQDQSIISSPNSSNDTTSPPSKSTDFSIPFSEFLDGEALR